MRRDGSLRRQESSMGVSDCDIVCVIIEACMRPTVAPTDLASDLLTRAKARSNAYAGYHQCNECSKGRGPRISEAGSALIVGDQKTC
jgi:hypothetical protein